MTEPMAWVTWYTPAWVPNAAASSTDVGSGAGGTTPSVGAAPAALPATTPEPMEARPEAEDSSPAGNAVTNMHTPESSHRISSGSGCLAMSLTASQAECLGHCEPIPAT